MSGQILPYDVMVLQTYKGPPDENYDAWLRSTDNPYFNSRPGIANYSNWRIVDHKKHELPYTYFDLVGLKDVHSLETVWFDPQLDVFRQKWVSRWGYNVDGAFVSLKESINQYGYLAFRTSGKRGESGKYLVVTGNGGGTKSSLGENWQVVETLQKHWAVDPGSAEDQWRKSVEQFNPLSVSSLLLQAVQSSEQWEDLLPAEFSFAFLAECLAAPDYKQIK